jgi:hypothetical protein
MQKHTQVYSGQQVWPYSRFYAGFERWGFEPYRYSGLLALIKPARLPHIKLTLHVGSLCFE